MAELFDVLTSDSVELASDFSVITDHGVGWDDVLTMTVTNLPAGTYMMCMSFLIDYLGAKDKSLWSRVIGTYSLGSEFADRASNDGDKKNRWYEKRVVHSGGNVTLTMQMSLGTQLTALTVNTAQLVINRVN